ncbi:MAG TPA: ERF family protein [Terriglobales bacterium]|nr:ERF family protein [Terriglobales bacterium]
MHRSSKSIAALASALAKAQTELTNPEKSLTAIIRADRGGEGARTFRYAPLSSGLEIVRKTLGKHEIAVFQTTAIDQPTRSVALTTMLTHSSGEWIASEWPVCPVSDMGAPHRMGAALTYARRYGLFTLVGIAGEDDLDAPDLNCQPVPDGGASGGWTAPDRVSPGVSGRLAGRQNSKGHGRTILEPETSAEVRDRLVREIVKLPSEEAAGQWASKVLPIKNTLISHDARLIETAFAFRISAFREVTSEPEPRESGPGSTTKADPDPVKPHTQAVASDPQELSSRRIDQSVLPFGETRRLRDKDHLKYVASRACVICGRQPSEPHHVRFAQKLAFGRKVSDEFTVPLCRLHHRELHRSRNEPLWWKTARIDPIPIAQKLWEATRPKAAPQPVTGDQSPALSVLPALPLPTNETPKGSSAKQGRAGPDAAAKSNHP